MSNKNLNDCTNFKKLSDIPLFSYKQFDAKRIQQYDVAGAGYRYNFSAKRVNDEILQQLYALSEEQQLKEMFSQLVNGEIVNTGEQRMVLHHALRGQLDTVVQKEGRNYNEFYAEQIRLCEHFAKKVHAQEIVGETGKPFDTFIQIGIGGSDLGPRAVYLAMRSYVYAKRKDIPIRKVGFISNVDPDDTGEQLLFANPETTLFILVSKSGTTQETLTNAQFALEWLQQAGITHPKKHMVCVTSETSPLAQSKEYLDSFFIDDYIGGRYSVSSAVGVCLLNLAYGSDITREFLRGAHESDKIAYTAPVMQNPAMIDALIGVYERNVLKYPYTAVLPYSQALSRFPAHLQQLDMESNGKQVNRFGEHIDYSTGPVVFGEPGTNGQHSFYQLLHQGTDIVPLQFIAFTHSQMQHDISYEGSTSQQKLLANLAAQIVAFSMGKENDNAHKLFIGNRPSSVLYADMATPYTLGALLSHFENKVMFQGFLWNINSFDQEGVQLGKVLTHTLLKGEPHPVLQSYYSLLS